MRSDEYALFRARWRANRRIDMPTPEEAKAEEESFRARLTHEQFTAIREAVLEGLKSYAGQVPVNSLRFKVLRDAWSELAQVQGKARFVIEVERE